MRKIKNLFKILIFFPSVTFSLLTAEIFPWAYIYTKIAGFKVYKRLFVLYLLFFFSVLFSVLISDFPVSFLEIIRSILAYLNPLLIFTFFYYKDNIDVIEYKQLIKYISYAFITFGLIQYTGSFIFLENIFRFFIPRLYMQQIGGGRGVSIFSSEPSRASYEFLFLFIFLRINQIKKYHIYYDLFYFIFSFFVIKSTTGILLAFIYFIPIYRKQLPYIFFFFLFSLPIIFDLFPNNRSIVIITALFNNLSIFSFKNIYLLLLNESGYRLISLIAAYAYGIYTFFGTGIGNWEIGISSAYKFLNIDISQISIFNQIDATDFVSTRPTAFLASFILDFGIFGLFILFITFRKIMKSIYIILPKNLFYTFIFYIFFVGDIGNPIPWIIVILTYKILIQEKNSVSSKI